MNNSYATSVRYGLLAGMIMIALIMFLYIIDSSRLGTFLPMFVYVPLIFLMVWGGITVRREAGGFKTFGQAFLAVFIISAVATMLFDTYGYLLYTVIDPELPEVIKEKVIENTTAMMERFGSTDEQIEEGLQRVRDQDYTPTLKTQAIRVLSSVAFGAFFSLLIALFIRRPQQEVPVKTEE